MHRRLLRDDGNGFRNLFTRWTSRLCLGDKPLHVALQVFVTASEISFGEGIVLRLENRLLGSGHLRLNVPRPEDARRIRFLAALFQPLQLFGDMHKGFVQRFKRARRALLARAAHVFQNLEIVGQRRDRSHVRATGSRLANAILRIGFHDRFGRLAGCLDDVFITGRQIILKRAHPAFELGRNSSRRHVARLADKARQVGDLILQAAQDLAVVKWRRLGFLEAGGDIRQPAFEPVETGVAHIGRRRRVKLVDAAGKIIEALGERIVDRTLVERIDLAGDVSEISRQVRQCGRLLRALQHLR